MSGIFGVSLEPLFTKEANFPIGRIAVSGLKSIADRVEISVKHLTVLAGSNSSGKSSILHGVLLLKQTLEAPFSSGDLRIGGPNVRFTDVGQMISKCPGERSSIEISVGNAGELLTWSYKPKGKSQRLILNEMRLDVDDGGPYSWSESLSETQKATLDSLTSALRKTALDRLEKKKYSTIDINDFTILIDKFRGGYQPIFGSNQPKKNRKNEANFGIKFLLATDVRAWARQIARVIHVPALRGLGNRTFQFNPYDETAPGRFDEVCGSLLHHWRRRERGLFKSVEKMLKDLGLANALNTDELDQTQLEILVDYLPSTTGTSSNRRPERSKYVNIADVGFGVSQVLPVLIALAAAKPHQLIYIEQPEIHLHPLAQGALAKLICAASNRGVRVVVETHSDHLLLELQSLIAEGFIRNENTVFHWFSRDPKTGSTNVKSVEPDKAGAIGDWPSDFVSIRRKAQERFLTATLKAKSKEAASKKSD